jgi:hypothetical protein
MSTKTTQADVEAMAQSLLDNDVLACDSALIDSLFGLAGETLHLEMPLALQSAFSVDQVEGLRPDPWGWDEEQCRAWLTKWLDGNGMNYDRDACLEDLRRTVEDADVPEIFEWWRVSESLAEELLAICEVVLRNEYGSWWGRTCTGQGILQDGTLQKVAKVILAR